MLREVIAEAALHAGGSLIRGVQLDVGRGDADDFVIGNVQIDLAFWAPRWAVKRASRNPARQRWWPDPAAFGAFAYAGHMVTMIDIKAKALLQMEGQAMTMLKGGIVMIN